MRHKAFNRIITLLSVCILTCLTSLDAVAAEIVLLGDSNTWLGGDRCDNPRGWSCRFAGLSPDDHVTSYARSGATWTATSDSRCDTEECVEVLSDNNIMFNQIIRLEQAVNNGMQPRPDIIMVMLGTNDAWFGARRPGIFGMTVQEALAVPADSLALDTPSRQTSLAMAVRCGVERLRRDFGDAVIVLMTPMQSTAPPAGRLEQVTAIIEAVGNGLAVPVMRMDTLSPVRSDAESAGRRLTTDGTHTTPEGAALTAEAVRAALDEMMTNRQHTH